MKRWLVLGVAAVLLLLFGVWHGYILYLDGPYHGRVIDLATQQPLEGVAVVAMWQKETPWIGHYIVSIYEVQETLTDPHGNFTIPGFWRVSLNPLAQLRQPLFTIFTPGYAAYGRWLAFKPRVVPQNFRIYDENGRTVFALGRLTTREERMRNLDKVFISPDVPREKYSHIIRLREMEYHRLMSMPKDMRKGDRP